MKLITDQSRARFKEIGSQSENSNPIIVDRYFDNAGSATWYATEYNEETKIAFGYVTGMVQDEWGYFSIAELETIQGSLGYRIEKDLYFKEKTFNEEFRKEQDNDRRGDLNIVREETFQSLDIDS